MDSLKQLEDMLKDHSDIMERAEKSLSEGMSGLAKEGNKEQINFITSIVVDAKKGKSPDIDSVIATFKNLNNAS